jgi:hypothetical protein
MRTVIGFGAVKPAFAATPSSRFASIPCGLQSGLKKVERAGRIELHPAWLGRPATQPVCLPAQVAAGLVNRSLPTPPHAHEVWCIRALEALPVCRAILAGLSLVRCIQRRDCASTKHALGQTGKCGPTIGRGRSCAVAAAWMDTRPGALWGLKESGASRGATGPLGKSVSSPTRNQLGGASGWEFRNVR